MYTDALVKKADQAGYQALVVTVDAPVNGRRYREQRVGFSMPDFAQAINLHDLPRSPVIAEQKGLTSHRAGASAHIQAGQGGVFESPMVRSALSWDELERVIASTSLPVILKGILHPEDALEGLARGAAGIVVSNHGGRVLDGMVASLDCLHEVAQAVKSFNVEVPVFFDGGIRSGSDILKALALGADAIMIGRPYLWALSVGGASGVAHVLHLLKTELEMAMVLCACRTLADIDERLIYKPSLSL